MKLNTLKSVTLHMFYFSFARQGIYYKQVGIELQVYMNRLFKINSVYLK